MVSKKTLVGAVVSVLVVTATVLGGYDIQSVSVVGKSSIHIKPCERVYVVLEATVAVDEGAKPISEVPPELVQEVVINGEAHRGVMKTGVNPVAFFGLHQMSVKQVEQSRQSFQVLVLLYWNIREQCFLFDEPGVYEVQFGEWAEVTVTVDPPTAEERELLKEMNEGGEKVWSCIFEPSSNRCVKLVPQFEQWIEQYPDTAYTGYLTVSVGISRLLSLPQEARDRPNFDLRAFLKERVALTRKYFEPYCKGEIESPFEAAAAYYLAEEVLNQLRFVPEPLSDASKAERRDAIALLRKVKKSPYSLDYGGKAASKLKRLGD